MQRRDVCICKLVCSKKMRCVARIVLACDDDDDNDENGDCMLIADVNQLVFDDESNQNCWRSQSVDYDCCLVASRSMCADADGQVYDEKNAIQIYAK